MTLRWRALVPALAVWGIAIASLAEEGTGTRVEPSLIAYQKLDARVELSADQRAFFAPYFASHAARLRDMRVRLNTGELSYVGALFEGRALERELSEESKSRLDVRQQLVLGEIRDSLRGEFRALFFKEEHAWLLRMFGRSGDPTPPTDTVEDASDEKS